MTDLDGNFELAIQPNDKNIVFSYTGYANLEVIIPASGFVDAKLKGGSILGEVVVVGYGSVKKRDATGAVTTITEKDWGGSGNGSDGRYSGSFGVSKKQDVYGATNKITDKS